MFGVPKDEVLAACYATTLQALVFRLALVKEVAFSTRAEQGASSVTIVTKESDQTFFGVEISIVMTLPTLSMWRGEK